MPETSLKQSRIVAPNAVYDLGDLEETKAAWPSGVKQTRDPICQHPSKNSVQTVGISRCPNLIEIEGCGLGLLETGLNPVDSTGMPVETDPHRQRNPQDTRRWTAAQNQSLAFHHGAAIDSDRVRGILFQVVPAASSRKDKIDGK